MTKPIKTKEDLELLLYCAKNYFGNGIYVKSDAHPCGWDFISFDGFCDVEDLMEEPILTADVSNGCYDCNPFERMSIFDVLQEVGEKWCFERSQIDW